jgi:hypothetical protein
MARRRSPIRTLLGLISVAGLGVGVWFGVEALRQHIESSDVILTVDSATADTPPATLPPEAALPEMIEPRTLVIDQIGLTEDVRAVGYEPDGGLEIPNETEIGWYRYGGSPGRPGATVLAAHVSWNGSIGPFHDLGALLPGEEVDVVLADGSTRRYEVVERTMYLKDALPADRIWTTTGEETLVLITCGGDFNPEVRRYRHNIVVYAVPVEHDAATA